MLKLSDTNVDMSIILEFLLISNLLHSFIEENIKCKAV